VASSSTDPRETARGPRRGEQAGAPAALAPRALQGVPGVLGDIARARAAAYAQVPAAAGLTSEARVRPPFGAALRSGGVQVIAEVKRSSPSQGDIAPLEPAEAARAYEAGGAAAISVLTEEAHFGGTLEHLREVARAVRLPLLRKDFTVHPRQLTEAREAGASAVLLIAAVLGGALAPYLAYAHALGLEALVEVHDEAELDAALAAGARVLGVNNRDLRTLEVDLRVAPRLLRAARRRGYAGVTVAESGYRSAAELEPLLGLADAVLVGTGLARSGDLRGALEALRGAG